jgi:hypothetical protein
MLNSPVTKPATTSAGFGTPSAVRKLEVNEGIGLFEPCA